MPSSFCERLVEERHRLSITQADIAQWTKIHRKTQAAYESGERSPDARYLVTLLEHGFDVAYLLTGQRPSPFGSVDTELLQAVYVALDSKVETAKRPITVREKARLFALVYQTASETGRIDPVVVERAIALLE